MTRARLTQAVAEVLRQPKARRVRAGQVVAEILRTGKPRVRVSQVTVEVLRPTAQSCGADA